MNGAGGLQGQSESVGETIRGNVAPGYGPVRDVFRGFFDKNWDTGSAVSVYRFGEPVVRLTGGFRIAGDGNAVA